MYPPIHINLPESVDDLTTIFDVCALPLNSLYALSRVNGTFAKAASNALQLSRTPNGLLLNSSANDTIGTLVATGNTDEQRLTQSTDIGEIRWLLRWATRIRRVTYNDARANVPSVGRRTKNRQPHFPLLSALTDTLNCDSLTSFTASLRLASNSQHLVKLIRKIPYADLQLSLSGGTACDQSHAELLSVLQALKPAFHITSLKLHFDVLDCELLRAVHYATSGKAVRELTLLKRLVVSSHKPTANTIIHRYHHSAITSLLQRTVNSLKPGCLEHLCVSSYRGPAFGYVRCIQRWTNTSLLALRELVLQVDARAHRSTTGDDAFTLWRTLPRIAPNLREVHIDRYIGSLSLVEFVQVVNVWRATLSNNQPHKAIRNLSIRQNLVDGVVVPTAEQMQQQWPVEVCNLKGTAGAFWGIAVNELVEENDEEHVPKRVDADFVFTPER